MTFIELCNWNGRTKYQIPVTPGMLVNDYEHIVRNGRLYEWSGESLGGTVIYFHEVNPNSVLFYKEEE